MALWFVKQHYSLLTAGGGVEAAQVALSICWDPRRTANNGGQRFRRRVMELPRERDPDALAATCHGPQDEPG